MTPPSACAAGGLRARRGEEQVERSVFTEPWDAARDLLVGVIIVTAVALDRLRRR